jgi:CHAT domain-containing protein
LRVLAVIASPAGYPPLDVEREWTNLKAALHDLEARGLVAVDRLTPPSIDAFQRQLLRQEYHILHFLGHGSFDAKASDSVLLLQDEAGQP